MLGRFWPLLSYLSFSHVARTLTPAFPLKWKGPKRKKSILLDVSKSRKGRKTAVN